jgi:mono/diheme cytochrome c family protein
LGGGAASIYSGFFDVAATDRHWPITEWIFAAAKTRSIKTQAAGIQAPPGLEDESRLVTGTEHFAAHCAVCHGAPGVRTGDIARGLHPAPPDLRRTARHLSDAEMF